MTHTYARLAVPKEFYDLVREKLIVAGYNHSIQQNNIGRPECIDMHGLALEADPLMDKKKSPALVIHTVDDGDHWGVSVDGHNPSPDNYFECINEEQAGKLRDYLNKL